MNSLSDKSKGSSKSNGPSNIKNIIADKVEKIKYKDYTCPFCREVMNGIAAFGRHLKGHCT